MLKVMIISETTAAGVRRQIVDILKYSSLNKFEFHVVYSSNRADKVFKNEYYKLAEKGIKFYDIPYMKRNISFFNDLRSIIKISKLVKKINPDIIHCHSSKAGALGRVSSLFFQKKVVYTPHAYISQDESLNKWKKNIFILIERYLAKFTKKTINVSIGENKFAINEGIINKDNSVVIYNGIERPEKKVSENQNISKKYFTIGTIARVDHQKDPYSFILIAEKVIKKVENVRFIYVGDGPLLKEMQNYTIEKNLNDKIQFIGFSENSNDILATFDIYISTSLYEGLPYSIIEALANYKPMIVSNVTGNNELVYENENGNLFEVGDITGAAKKIINLYSDGNLQKKYKKRSNELFEKKFTVSKMIKELEELYLSL